MQEPNGFGLADYPEHRRKLEEQEDNLGMEACTTHEQRVAYVRRLVRGIFQSDLPDVRVINRTNLMFGKSSLTPIPEFEQMRNMWNDFPSEALALIIEEEQKYAKGEHLTLLDEPLETSSEKNVA